MSASVPQLAARPDPRVLVLLSTNQPHQRDMLRGLTQYLREQGPWEVLFLHRPQTQEAALPRPERLGGVIVDGGQEAQLQRVAAWKVPTVAISGTARPRRMGWVVADNVQVGRMAFQYLQSLGLEHFAYCHAHAGPADEDRFRGYSTATTGPDGGAQVHQSPRSGRRRRVEWQAEAPELVQWVRQLPKPIGIFAATDDRARHLAVACQEAGVHVPDEVAILGVNNDWLLCELAYPPLSSIDHGGARIGYEAARLLDAMMKGEPAPREPIVVPPVGVVARQSTDTLAIADRSLTAAVRFIRRNVGQGIRVPDVLRAVPTSRRSLEMAFRRVLGRTIHEEIIRVRIEHAKDLLVHSDLAMPEITDAAGFTSPSQLSALFRRHVGMPPSHYRRQRKDSQRRAPGH